MSHMNLGEVFRIPIDHASNGDNTLVPAMAGMRITVLQFGFVAAGSATVRFESAAGGTALTGQMSCVAQTVVVSPYVPDGLFYTNKGELLNLELSAGVSVDGWLIYRLDP